MIRLGKALEAWGTPEFNRLLKQELEQLEPGQLPLQQGLALGSHALEDDFEVMVLDTADEGEVVRVKVGIFYSGMIAGCNCADDPTPVERHPEYCEAVLRIHKQTAEATLVLAE